MTMTIELPASALEALTSEAQRRGITPEQVAADDLRRMYDGARSAASNRPKTGADLLAIMEQEGLFVSREGQPDSPELARQIREEAWRRS